jgi:hypothetical protein
MGFHALVNTRYFSEAATDWFKNGGRYTTAPQGSRDYLQYWEEQERRCTYGYKVGDLWIPGRYYGYLNFSPMSRIPDETLNEARNRKGRLTLATAEKSVLFPSFWEIDYEWWNFKHIAWYGGKFMGIDAGYGGKHLCCLKTRGAGFSYKEAWDGVYNYNFIDGSKSYYFAATEPFLIGDAIMDKVQSGLDWINTYCPYWKKNRQVHNTLMHQKASYRDEFNLEKGTMSEIIAQIVDRPSKTRGKRGRKATFEEAGSFPHMEEALQVCMGSMRDGSIYVGQVSVFGTGGEQGAGIQGLENVFNAPEAWDMLAFNNIWESGMQGTECGYFVPCYRANNVFMDTSGNVDMINCIDYFNGEREKKKKSKKPKTLDTYKAEYPYTPSEALQRLNGNGFNAAECNAQVQRIQSNKAIQELLRYGDLIRNPESPDAINGIDFIIKPKSKAKPIEDYPHNQADDLTGCVTIVQRPYQDANGKVPAGMYQITFDAYYKDESQDLTSLFDITVWKQDNPYDQSMLGVPVGWYTGRPKNSDRVMEILFMLCDMYNCTAQGEISGGGQAVVTYAKQHMLLHRLEHEPEMAHNKELASKAAGNSYLMNMAPERKKLGLLYMEDWHMSPYGVDDKGNLIPTIRKCYKIGLCREMAKFNPERGNFDRISSSIIFMFMFKERRAKMFKMQRESREFYSNQRIMFGGTSYGGDQGVTTAY